MGYVPAVSRPWTLVRRYGLHALISCAALEAALSIWLRGDAAGAPRTPLWFSMPAAAAIVLSLLGWRRFPFGAPVAVWLTAICISFVDGRIVAFPVGVFAAGMLASFLLGNLPASQARLGLCLVLGAAVIVAYNDPGHDVGQLIAQPVVFGMLWLGGMAVRERVVQAESAQQRASQLEAEREEAEQRAIAEERTRIAREMHDVVGHGLSVMTVQAAAVRRLLRPEQARERESLLAVERTGRDALTEMRRLVDVLRDPSDAVALAPPPSLAQLPKLIVQARETGLPVDLTVEGEPVPLPAGVELTAYRVVQEGLTNAIRHSQARHAEVHVRYRGNQLEVDVRDDGRAPPRSTTGGHGLAGMRERVAAYDGQLDAGPRPEGGYQVRALLPVRP